MSILDMIFPKRCIACRSLSSLLCHNCFSMVSFVEKNICVVCQKRAIGGFTHPVCRTKYGIDGVFASISYNGVVKKIIYCFKYAPYIRSLKEIMGDLFYEGLIQNESFHSLYSRKTFLVPIPLHSSKFRQRGYNQAEILAKGLSEKLNLPVIDCLVRSKKTVPQFGLSKERRAENIRDAFSFKAGLSGRMGDFDQAFLIDDLLTSGTTMKEAAKVLKKQGINNVFGVALAHGD